VGTIKYSGQAGDEYHRIRHKEIFGNDELIKAWGSYAQETYLKGVRPGHRVLEVGAGTGFNLHSVNGVADVTAIEPSEEAREHCRGLGINTLPSIEDLPTDARFDYILMRHVLEHVEEPVRLLVRSQELLAPDGKLVLVLPVESPFKKINPDDIDHHLYCWNRQTMGNLLASHGFKVTQARINPFNGRRIFLPVFRWAGLRYYSALMKFLGMVIPHSEIIMVAKVADKTPD
jgi:SAM-dependent methyltransferase